MALFTALRQLLSLRCFVWINTPKATVSHTSCPCLQQKCRAPWEEKASVSLRNRLTKNHYWLLELGVGWGCVWALRGESTKQEKHPLYIKSRHRELEGNIKMIQCLLEGLFICILSWCAFAPCFGVCKSSIDLGLCAFQVPMLPGWWDKPPSSFLPAFKGSPAVPLLLASWFFVFYLELVIVRWCSLPADLFPLCWWESSKQPVCELSWASPAGQVGFAGMDPQAHIVKRFDKMADEIHCWYMCSDAHGRKNTLGDGLWTSH